MSNTRDEVGQPDGSVAFFPEPPRVQQWVDPASPDWCLAKHSERSLYLSAFEQVEIKSYPHVWFVGKPGVTKPVPRRAGTVPPENIRLANANRESNENSNDDEWDDPHDVVFVDHTRHYSGLALGDHLGFRFEICSTLGKGTFAKVVKCLDHKTGQSVAVKVTRNARRFKQQVRSEIKILNLLGRTPGHHNVVALTETFAFRGHQCLVFSEHGVSLAEWLRNENNDKNDAGEKQTLKLKQSSSRVVGASSGFTKRVGTQLVQALLFLENNAVIHCDLKLENILLRRANGNSSQIVLVDFGSAMFCDVRIIVFHQIPPLPACPYSYQKGKGSALHTSKVHCVLIQVTNITTSLTLSASIAPGVRQKRKARVREVAPSFAAVRVSQRGYQVDRESPGIGRR